MAATKSRRGRVARAFVGPLLPGDHKPQAKEQPIVADNDPPPILAIIDVQTSFVTNAAAATAAAQRMAGAIDAGSGMEVMAVHNLLVCADNAIRVPEALAIMRKAMLCDPSSVRDGEGYFDATLPCPPRSRTLADVDPATASACVFQTLSVLAVTTNQACFVECCANSLAAGYLNSQINQSKRPTVSDNTTMLNVTAFDVFVGGLKNIRQSFQGTGYCGSYGPRVDTGIGSVGLLAKNVTSDGRQHGSQLLSEKVADRLVGEIAKNMFGINEKERKAWSRPLESRGVPHGLVMGVHACLDECETALQVIERVTGSDDRQCKTGLLVLPLSRYTQSLAPVVDPASDTSQRLNLHPELDRDAILEGRAYLPDQTCESDAIFTEPHVNRPNQASLGSNFMATAYENASVVLESSAMIALLAREAYCYCFGLGQADGSPMSNEACVDWLHNAITSYVFSRSSAPEENLVCAEASVSPLVATAVLLINCIFPQNFEIGSPILLEAFARGPAATRNVIEHAAKNGQFAQLKATRMRRCLAIQESAKAMIDAEEADDEMIKEATVFWSAFDRDDHHTSAWPPLRALLLRILNDDGRHDATTADCQSMRQLLVSVMQSAWLVASKDGVAKPLSGPASEVDAPTQLLNPQFAPVFFTTERVEARGGLCGMQRFQFRQVLSLVAGCGVAPRAQVVRNEGNLTSRTCAAADLLKKSGEKRAKKGYSALQTDSDHLGFGSEPSKLITSAKQRKAYDDNTIICLPILARLSEPLPFLRRWQGEFIANNGKKRSLQVDKNQPISQRERVARRYFYASTHSALQRACESRMQGIAADMAR